MHLAQLERNYDQGESSFHCSTKPQSTKHDQGILTHLLIKPLCFSIRSIFGKMIKCI